jgi:hypothetical protein
LDIVTAVTSFPRRDTNPAVIRTATTTATTPAMIENLRFSILSCLIFDSRVEGGIPKNQAMVDDAPYGLMLWDGESKGTLNSVVNMIRQEKPVVYLAPKRTFQNLRSSTDLRDLLANCDRASLERFERELVRIQKTLEDANLKLTRVVSDILGTRGRTILKASVGGEAGPERLANLTTHRGSRSAIFFRLRAPHAAESN